MSASSDAAFARKARKVERLTLDLAGTRIALPSGKWPSRWDDAAGLAALAALPPGAELVMARKSGKDEAKAARMGGSGTICAGDALAIAGNLCLEAGLDLAALCASAGLDYEQLSGACLLTQLETATAVQAATETTARAETGTAEPAIVDAAPRPEVTEALAANGSRRKR